MVQIGYNELLKVKWATAHHIKSYKSSPLRPCSAVRDHIPEGKLPREGLGKSLPYHRTSMRDKSPVRPRGERGGFLSTRLEAWGSFRSRWKKMSGLDWGRT